MKKQPRSPFSKRAVVFRTPAILRGLCTVSNHFIGKILAENAWNMQN